MTLTPLSTVVHVSVGLDEDGDVTRLEHDVSLVEEDAALAVVVDAALDAERVVGRRRVLRHLKQRMFTTRQLIERYKQVL